MEVTQKKEDRTQRVKGKAATAKSSRSSSLLRAFCYCGLMTAAVTLETDGVIVSSCAARFINRRANCDLNDHGLPTACRGLFFLA
jgi:hypothetical protein